jgi:hypothetical protein
MTLHFREHFGHGEPGVLIVRQMPGDQLDAIAADRDPTGVRSIQTRRRPSSKQEFHSRGLN